MSKKNEHSSKDDFSLKETIEDKDYFLDDEIDAEDEDYWLDDEEDSDDYWLDDEEDSDDYWLDDEEDSEDYWLDEEDTGEKEQQRSDSVSGTDAQEDTGDESGSIEDIEVIVTQNLRENEELCEEGKSDVTYDKESTESENDEEEDEESDEEDDMTVSGQKATKKGKRSKKIAIISGSIIAVFAVIYIGISVFFMSHFNINTEINGHDFSVKTVNDVEEYMKQQVADYTLTILEKENKTDIIRGEDISLVYESDDEIENALKQQNAFLWPMAFFGNKSTKVTVDVSYDEEQLENQIQSLQSVTVEQIPATSAYPKYNGSKFVVEPEVTGTAVDMERLREKINQYITEFQPELDMLEEGCYALPQYTSDSPEVQDACDEMNRYLEASITYTMDENVVVDKELIYNWVTVDSEMKVTFNEEAVRQWLTEFGDKYDTVGTTRTIITPYGKTAEVSGGTYGWGIDEEAEFTALTNSIKNGEVVTKEPAYCIGQTAASHGPQDWGTTYAEVDLSAQHMWYIVDGSVALESDVVTGVPTPKMETPSGVYSILEKESPSVLVGEDDPNTGKPIYETQVAYWMRITWSGIGFHDATWQPAFGGNLYSIGAGSHGCVNMPYDKAGALYEMMPVGTPVIIHY